jgi:membrane-bound lytic murein transglycosylase D
VAFDFMEQFLVSRHRRTKQIPLAVVIATLAALLVSCASPAPKTVKVTPPALRQLPNIDRQVDPIAAALPSELPQVNFNDPVDMSILGAQLRFAKGEELSKQGSVKQAKDEFNSAIDLILETAANYPKEPRLQRELTDLVARVHAIELAAMHSSDTLSDETDEHAAIDDLEKVETFPALIDPKFKKAVEDEVEQVAHDLPIEINDRVLGFIDYYQNGRGRNSIELGLERAGRYQPMIARILKEEGVPLDLIYLCQAESAFEPRALSRAAAKGMWQFISARGKEYGLRQTWWIDERSDPEKSTRAAARHLKDLYQEFGDWYLAMAAYNSGPVRVHRALEKVGADNFWTLADKKVLPKETINYIPNILALTIIGKNPEKYGFSVAPAQPLETERVSVDKATDLRVIADAIDVPVEELRGLNSHVLRWTTPPDDPDFQLILPKGYAAKFNEQISTLPDNKRILFREHVVRKGETLGTIAKKYGMSVGQVSQANHFGNSPILKVGQTLVIPLSGVAPPPRQPTASSAKSQPVTKPVSTSPVVRASYTVRPGDTLGKIAARFNTSVDRLRTWNHLTSNQIAVGHRLVVSPSASQTASKTPRKVIHRVQQGETLDFIATTYKTSVNAILSWNESEDLSVLHPGDRITIFLGDSN